jgi:nucleotide-binding universal stress UspA family protein
VKEYSAMLRRILVPLDGSALAERAVPYATELAAAAAASLVLVRTSEAHHHIGSGWHTGRSHQAVEAYLAQQLVCLTQMGLMVEMAVPRGSPPEALVAEIEFQRPDLVIMATHARSGLGRALLGGLCDAVIGAGRTPTLLVRASANLAVSPTRPLLPGAKILVPLNGTALAEAGLPIALELARVLRGELVLFQTVSAPPTPYSVPWEFMSPGVFDVQMDWNAGAAVRDAAAYLQLMADFISATTAAQGVVVHTCVQIGQLAEQIRLFAGAPVSSAESRIGLIVMATHGRTGFSRTLLGSTTDEVLRSSDVPLVVVRPPVRTVLPHAARAA